jgi:hypothetical protein
MRALAGARSETGERMKSLVAAVVAVVVVALSASALADPASLTENGCHY